MGIKTIAMGSMLIDHIGAVVLRRMLTQQKSVLTEAGTYQSWDQCYHILRNIGRLAFPLYCFLLVQGFFYTRSRIRYTIQMFLFAILSEIPFDLAFNYSSYSKNEGFIANMSSLWRSNNVFWTLGIGLVCLGMMEHCVENSQKLCIAVVGMGLAEYVFHTDYGAVGVSVILVYYFYSRNPLMATTIGVFLLAFFSSKSEWYALLNIFVIGAYNGTYGIANKKIKYLFYGFYPLHLLLLVFLAAAVELSIL